MELEETIELCPLLVSLSEKVRNLTEKELAHLSKEEVEYLAKKMLSYLSSSTRTSRALQDLAKQKTKKIGQLELFVICSCLDHTNNISHFAVKQITFHICLKARPSAKHFVWKLNRMLVTVRASVGLRRRNG